METTAITVIERAAVALGSSKAEAELLALAAQSQSITAITNAAGREECHAAAMVAKSARIAVEKTAKTAREDATAFSRAVIAEGSRLVALIEPEESRLLALRDEWDSAVAREKAAEAEAERIALAQIRTRIDNIKAWPLLAANASPAAVLDDIARLEALEVDDSFGASYGEAVEAKAVSLAKLREIHAAKVAEEAEAARVREELAAQAEQNRLEREENALVESIWSNARRIEGDSVAYIVKAMRTFESGAGQFQDDARPRVKEAVESARNEMSSRLQSAKSREDERRQIEAERAEIAEARRLIAEANASAEAKRIADAAVAQKAIDDALAADKRAADVLAEKHLHELAEKQAAEQVAEHAEQQKTASAPEIAVEQTGRGAPPWISDLHEIAHRLNDHEGARLVHYARRLISERQAAA